MNKFENSKIFQHRTNLLDRNVFKDDHLKEIFLEILKNNPGIKVKLYHSKNAKYIVYEAGEIKVEKIKNSKILEEVYKFNIDGVFCQFIPIDLAECKKFNESKYNKMNKQLIKEISNFLNGKLNDKNKAVKEDNSTNKNTEDKADKLTNKNTEIKAYGCQYNLLDETEFKNQDVENIFLESGILNDDNITVRLYNRENVKNIVRDGTKINIEDIPGNQKEELLATGKCSGVFWKFIDKNDKIDKDLCDEMAEKLHNQIILFMKSKKDKDIEEAVKKLEATEASNLIKIFDGIITENGDSFIVFTPNKKYIYTRFDELTNTDNVKKVYTYNKTIFTEHTDVVTKGLRPDPRTQSYGLLYRKYKKHLEYLSRSLDQKYEIKPIKTNDAMYKNFLYNIKKPNKTVNTTYTRDTEIPKERNKLFQWIKKKQEYRQYNQKIL